MSQLHQPLLVATVNYHVGHAMSLHVAERCGFFREEKFDRYSVKFGGLVPTAFERVALGPAMAENGVDIAVGASTDAAVIQRACGEDVCVVAGWRLDGPAGSRWYASADRPDLQSLRGAKVGVRESGGMEQTAMSRALRRAGVDPQDVAWVYSADLYVDEEVKLAALTSGRVDAVGLRPPADRTAERLGYRMVFDASTAGQQRPGRVVIATRRTVEARFDELTSFLRANLRAFWYLRDGANFEALRDLESELRVVATNDAEFTARLITSPEVLDRWPLPVDGRARAEQFHEVIAELLATGEVAPGLSLSDVVDEGPMLAVLDELSRRAGTAADYARARRVVARVGY